MEITVTEVAPSTKNVKITVSKENVQKKYNEQIKEINMHAQIPGFRNGRIPRRVIERKFGSTILDELKRTFLVSGYEYAVKEHNLQPISEPGINPDEVTIEKDKECSFEFTVEVRPEFTLPEYSGLELTKTVYEITDKEVDESIEDLRERKSEMVPLESGKSEAEDVLVCKATIHVDSEEIWSNENTALSVEDTELAGIKIEQKSLENRSAEEEFKQEVTLPEDFENEEYAGKNGELSLTVLDIKRKQKPELNDEFAKEVECDTVEQLRERIKEQLVEGYERTSKSEMEDQIMKHLLENIEVPLPEGFLGQRIADAEKDLRNKLGHNGMSEEDITKKLEEDKEQIRESVIEKLSSFLILEDIAEKEGVEVEKQDIDKHFNELAPGQGLTKEMREFFEKQGFMDEIRAQIKQSKIFAAIIEKAKVSEETKSVGEAKSEENSDEAESDDK